MRKGRGKRVLIISGSIVLFLILVVVAAGLYLQSRADTIIGREFSKLTHGQYKLEAGAIGVNLFKRSVTFNNLRISPDSATTTATSPDRILPGTLLDFSAEKLLIAGIRFSEKGGKYDIGIRRLELSSPHIKYTQRQEVERPDKRADTTGVSRFRVAIKRIVVSRGYAEQGVAVAEDTIRNVIEGFELETSNFLIDSDSGGFRSALGDDTQLSVARITHMPTDQSTRFELDSLYVGTRQQLLQLAALRVIPTYSKAEFAIKSWRHKDWTEAGFTGISCHGTDYGRMLAEGKLYIDSVRVSGGSLSSYKNRNVHRKEWIKPLYSQIIQRLPVRFRVRTVSLAGLSAQYEELAEGADRPGVITFGNIGGEVHGLGNIPTSTEKYSKWVLQATMLDAAPLHVTGFMPIDSLNDRWEMMGLLGGMKADLLNRMITPLANIEITDGQINKMDFHVVGSSVSAHVDMTFLYNDLKIALLKDKDGHISRRGFLSGLVNDLLLLQSNPLYGETRQAEGEFTRDPYKSPWNYLWKTIFSGLKDAVGLGKL